MSACLLYPVAEAAKLLSMSTWSLKNYIKLGEIRALKVGKRWMLNHKDLEEFANKDHQQNSRTVNGKTVRPEAVQCDQHS